WRLHATPAVGAVGAAEETEFAAEVEGAWVLRVGGQGAHVALDEGAVTGPHEGLAAVGAAEKALADGAHVKPVRSHDVSPESTRDKRRPPSFLNRARRREHGSAVQLEPRQQPGAVLGRRLDDGLPPAPAPTPQHRYLPFLRIGDPVFAHAKGVVFLGLFLV